MTRELEAHKGDELRIICPRCKTMWSTLRVPSECDTCGALVTITARGGRDLPKSDQK